MAGLEAMVTWLAMADETDKDHHEVRPAHSSPYIQTT